MSLHLAGEQVGNWGKRSCCHGRQMIALVMLFLVSLASSALAEQRFPPPDFTDTNHQIPVTATPWPREAWLQYLDVTVLLACLGIAVWLIYKQRSRKQVWALSIFSLLYFGFWREGCICAIGAPQNIALG